MVIYRREDQIAIVYPEFSYLQNFAYLHASFDYEFAMDLFDRKTSAVISAT